MSKLATTLPGLAHVVHAVHTADCGSFTAAAERLGLTPAAVSKSVAALEAALEVRLFNRTSADLAGHDLLRVRFLTGRMSPWVFKTPSATKTSGSQPKDAQPTAAFEGAAQLVISDPALMLDAALLHLGIAHIGRHHAHEALARGSLVEVLASEHVSSSAQMSLFYPHRAGLAPRVRVLVDHLLASFASQPALQALPVRPLAKASGAGRRKKAND